MKKVISILIIFTIVFSFIIVEGDGKEDIKIDAQVGFDKTYRPGFTTPIFITMENNYKDIEGELQIELPSDERLGGANTVTLYALGINHPKNTKKKYVMNISLPSSLLNVKLKIVEGKKIVKEEYIRIDKRIPDGTVCVGVLTDKRDSLNYLKGFSYNNISDSYASKIIDIDEEVFPDTSDVMDNFNVIIINDFNTSKLKEKQYDALKKWVQQGGFLVIGTGANGAKTLSIFEDDFILGDRGDLKSISANAIGKFVNDELDAFIDVMDLNIEGGETLLSQDGLPLIQLMEKGNGRILLQSFDMGMEPVSNWNLNRVFMEKLLGESMSSMLKGAMFEKFLFGRGYNWNIETALKNIPELPSPRYSRIIVLFIIYIILVAPVSYYVLKRIDKRELLWGTVPIFSLVFAVLVYISGFDTRITEPILNTISIVYGDEKGIIEAKSFGGVFTPKRSNIVIEGLGDVSIRPFSMNNYYANGSIQDWDGKRVSIKYNLAPKASIEFYDMGVWSMKTFSMDSRDYIQGNLESYIYYQDSKFAGHITNKTDLDFEDCFIMTSSEYFEIGDIKAGENKKITENKKNSYRNGYELMDQLFKDIYSRGQVKDSEEQEEIKRDMQKRSILGYFFDSQIQRSQGVTFLGWASADTANDILINGENIKRYDNTLFIVNLQLDTEMSDNIEFPFGYIEPRIEKEDLREGSFDSYNNRFYGVGDIELSYDIGSHITLEKVDIWSQDISSATKQFIYNYDVNEWQAGDFKKLAISGDDIGKYLGKDNVLRLRFSLGGDGIELPQISVKGSAK